MAYLPTITARLAFDTTDFNEKVDRAKAKLDSLNKSFTDTVKVKVDNSALRQIAQDTEAMHRIMGRNESLRIKANLDDGEAKARLAALTRDRTATIHVRTDTSQAGMLGSLLDKAGGALSGGSGLTSPYGIAGIAGAAAALLPELTGIVSGLVAAGAGASAFGALALPAFHAVSGALSQIKKDQEAYNRATTDKGRADALKHLQDDWKGLDPVQRQAVNGIQKLSASFHAMSKAFEPQVFKVFNAGLKDLGILLPHAAPFASTFATSMTRLLQQLGNGMQTRGFSDFLNKLHSIEGPAINSIGQGIGQVAAAFGRLITVMSGKDVAHTINIAFGAISGTINGLTSTVRFLMNAWDGMGIAFQNVKGSLHGLAGMFDNVRHGLADMGDSILHSLEGIPGSIAHIASRMVAPFRPIPGQIKGFFSGAAGWLISAGSGIIHGLASGARSAWSAVSGFFSGAPGRIKAFFAGAGGWLVSAGQAIMSGLLAGITSAWNKVASFLSSLAGKIKSLKGPLDYDRVMLYPHGQAIMQGLMAGMGSQVPALESQLQGITNSISSAAGNGHGALAGAGGEIHVHNVIQLDGRVLHTEMSKHAVQTQRRTGTNGMTKRTR